MPRWSRRSTAAQGIGVQRCRRPRIRQARLDAEPRVPGLLGELRTFGIEMVISHPRRPNRPRLRRLRLASLRGTGLIEGSPGGIGRPWPLPCRRRETARTTTPLPGDSRRNRRQTGQMRPRFGVVACVINECRPSPSRRSARTGPGEARTLALGRVISTDRGSRRSAVAWNAALVAAVAQAPVVQRDAKAGPASARDPRCCSALQAMTLL